MKRWFLSAQCKGDELKGRSQMLNFRLDVSLWLGWPRWWRLDRVFSRKIKIVLIGWDG